MRNKFCLSTLLLLILSCLVFPVPMFGDGLIQPKVLVIATYETGKDRGDVPGELQFWAERQNLNQEIRVPGIDHPILTNGKGLYAMISGTTSRCAVQLMALAMDPRFDLRHTYFLLSGIAGADPAQITVGSAVWIRHVVDGDPAFELDHKETPASWPYGIIALGATQPDTVPPNVDSAPAAGVSDNGSGGVGRVAYTLNASLVDWAYSLTKSLVIPDSQALAANRAPYKSFPNALQRPLVVEGDSMGADRFWSGAIMTKWAEDWVRLYTHGTGALAIADCEDQGIVLAVHELDRLGRVDANRLLILRTASNFTVPPPGVSAEKFLFDDLANSPGYIPALDANYQAGSVVVANLLENWDRYENTIP
ncbi:MAG TPA: purine nucleoside permease [Terracidiphilus sp.]|nr:purine nucleoside permease [Terracidiphilus sp.]